jgi:hypothetical protein
MNDNVTIHFNGPYSFSKKDNSLFESKYAKSTCVNLCVIKTDSGNLIHYIGETANFSKRHKEHLINILGLNYGIFDPIRSRGWKQAMIWHGLWRDKSQNPVEQLIDNYSKLTSKVIEYIDSLDIYFAETDIDVDVRRHIEGSIGGNLRK